MSHEAQGKAVPRSELVHVVAWMQIVGAGFWALVSLMLLGFALAFAWASHAAPQLPPRNPWPLFGVGCFFLAGALVLLGSGLGLRHRMNWARRLTAVLCYIGVFGAIAIYCLEFAGLSHMLAQTPATADTSNIDLPGLIGLILKLFLGSLTLATVALLVWVANRLNKAAIVAEFHAAPRAETAGTE